MRRLIQSLVALFFPWLSLLIHDNPGGALIALLMQVTLIGWPFASLWALKVNKEVRQMKVYEKARKRAEAKRKKEEAAAAAEDIEDEA